MKKAFKALIILGLFIVQSFSYSSQLSLAEYISSQFKRPFDQVTKILDLADKYSYSDFPRKIDVLAVIAVESGFRPNVANNHSNGLMQVNYGSFEFEGNIKAGVKQLRDNYLAFNKSKEAAYHAYNLGPGAYRKGKRVPKYVAKVARRSAELSKFMEV